MSFHYMPMYWGDYLGDTAHLSAIEHGGYLLLIAHYWRTGELPQTDAQIARVARMTMKEWRKHGATILAFFPDGKNPRLDRELSKIGSKIEKNKLSAKKRWESYKSDNILKNQDAGDANAYANALQPQCEGNDNQNQNQNNKDILTENRTVGPKKRATEEDQGFADFWTAYPRKENKGAARRAWSAAIKKVAAEQIISAVKRAKWNADQKFIPHPASWLNGERWADEVAAPLAAVSKPIVVKTPREAFEAKFMDSGQSLRIGHRYLQFIRHGRWDDSNWGPHPQKFPDETPLTPPIMAELAEALDRLDDKSFSRFAWNWNPETDAHSAAEYKSHTHVDDDVIEF